MSSERRMPTVICWQQMTLLYTGGRAQFYTLRGAISIRTDGDQSHRQGRKAGHDPVAPDTRGPTERASRLAILPNGVPVSLREGFWYADGPESEPSERMGGMQASPGGGGPRGERSPSPLPQDSCHDGKKLGLDPQFLQAILAHESVTMTLDRYAEVELEDVKR